MEFEYLGIRWKLEYGLEAVDVREDQYGHSYETIIEKLHPTIKWNWVMDDSYQGDFYGCGKDYEGKWYFIEGSFGSCSGCDWLQSINTIEEAQKFLDHFKKVIIQKDTKEEILAYMKDTTNNQYWSKDTLWKLINKVEVSD